LEVILAGLKRSGRDEAGDGKDGSDFRKHYDIAFDFW
jgi:hypothetical protein